MKYVHVYDTETRFNAILFKANIYLPLERLSTAKLLVDYMF